MEDGMLSIRIVTAGAILVMAVGGAAAQTATGTAPGKPISLLQVLEKPAAAKPKPHVKSAFKTAGKTVRKTHKVAASRDPKPAPAQTATAALPANVWPGLSAPADAPIPTPDIATAAVDPTPSEIVVGGHTVQVASPDDVNDIDLAADHQDGASDTAPNADLAQADHVTQAMFAAPAQQDESQVGSASWIAKVLAALGGAVAAGSAAWFLIGTTPQRTYG
jgi:hypothetical protein